MDAFQEAIIFCLKNLSHVENSSVSFQKTLFDISFDMAIGKTHVSTCMLMSKEIQNLMKINLKYSSVKLAEKMTCKNPKNVIDDIMIVYNYDNVDKFLERQLPLLMSEIVFLACQREVRPALDYIAAQLGKKVKVLLVDHFPIIFPKLVTQVTNTEEYQACTQYLEDIIKLPIKDLVQSERQKIITELLLHFHSNQKRVYTGFSFIAKHDDDFKCKGKKNTLIEFEIRGIYPLMLQFFRAYLS